MEKSTEYTMPLTLALMNFLKAFDTIGLNSIHEALQEYHIDCLYSKHNIYNNAKMMVQLTSSKIKSAWKEALNNETLYLQHLSWRSLIIIWEDTIGMLKVKRWMKKSWTFPFRGLRLGCIGWYVARTRGSKLASWTKDELWIDEIDEKAETCPKPPSF